MLYKMKTDSKCLYYKGLYFPFAAGQVALGLRSARGLHSAVQQKHTIQGSVYH